MADFEWLGEAKRKKPDGLYEIVVRQKGIGQTTWGVATQVYNIAHSILTEHRYQGHSHIKISRGDRSDAFVNLDDSEGKGAAWKIERHTGALRKAAGLV